MINDLNNTTKQNDNNLEYNCDIVIDSKRTQMPITNENIFDYEEIFCDNFNGFNTEDGEYLLASVQDRISKCDVELAQGILEIYEDGFGHLYLNKPICGNEKIFVPPKVVKYFDLRNADAVFGTIAQDIKTGTLVMVMANKIDGVIINPKHKRPNFDKLLPIYPKEKFNLCTPNSQISLKLLDLILPIAIGQRALIIAPPNSGVTNLIIDILNNIKHYHQNSKMVVLLSNKRPEEVTDMEQNVDAEIYVCNYEDKIERNLMKAQIAIERCKRLVEGGFDAVLVVDSLTSIARSYNLIASPSGKMLYGWFDLMVFNSLKQYFGYARNVEGKGSLTIFAILTESDEEVDKKIYNELKSISNMELHLQPLQQDDELEIDWTKSYALRQSDILDSQHLLCIKEIRKNLINSPTYIDELKSIVKSHIANADIINFILNKTK